MGNPPEVPQRMNWTSPSAPLVADPVAGPCLCTFTITRGISPMIARPMFSEYRLIPGPEEAVIARRPAATAPRHIPMDEISSSPWMTTPPRPGSSFTVSYTHLRAHETDSYLVCRLLLEKKKTKN